MKRKADMFKRINDQRARLKRMDEADKRDQAAKQELYKDCKECKSGALHCFCFDAIRL